MRSFRHARSRVSLLLLVAAVSGASLPARAAAPRSLRSEHFVLSYDPDRLDLTAAEAARDAAERGYDHCRRVFGSEPSVPIRCDLTPERFMGATGYAVPDRRPRIGVRVPDLPYLGLNGPYVLTHEIAHVFSGRAASGPLGEGLADFVAGDFADISLRPWWGGVLRKEGLWVDPDALFVTGEYPASAELDARIRVALYTEPALLIQFLVGEFGFAPVWEFLPAYTRARRSLASNEDSRERRARRPDPEAVRRCFQTAFGKSWEQLRAQWEASLEATPPSEAVAERVRLGQQVYAAIRNYEMWQVRSRKTPPEWAARQVRQAFVDTNRALRQSRLAEAQAHFATASRLIDRLRRPMLSADASFLQRRPGDASLNPGRSFLYPFLE